MRTISLKLPEDLIIRLETAAADRHISKSQVIRESLEKTFGDKSGQNELSCYDLAYDLIGAPDGDVPADLATNPKYMDDFGK